ncbi:hypothetical protein ATE48_08590 [Candidatus Viadribacter manganicus]|uniref:Uncharacterized protein n=1 Tax=Candidatus Viadribacter manganicus TaxID=1759059 RepID=A0A1B1AHD9_9PROT|nr:hypothetical protein ATE48_08590 [Candidatus Viadribacter manganicus]
MVLVLDRPQITDLHRAIAHSVLRVELAAIALEASDHRDRIKPSVDAADEIDRPLPRFGIEQSQRQS